MLAKTSAANFVSVPSAAMAERRDTFLVMVQAPGLCMEGAGQGGKSQLSHDMIGMGHWRAIRAGGQGRGRSLPTAALGAIMRALLANRKKRNAFRLALISSTAASCAGRRARHRRISSRIAAGKTAWFWPTIAVALATKHHWMVDRRPDLNLSMKPHDPAPIRVALDDVRCLRCNRHGRGDGDASVRESRRAHCEQIGKLYSSISGRELEQKGFEA